MVMIVLSWPAVGTSGVGSSVSRAERVAYLRFSLSYAALKDDSKESLGVSTGGSGGGRSYDFVAICGELSSIADRSSEELARPLFTGLRPL